MSILKGSFLLIGGAIFAQLLTILFSPFLVKLYGASGLGYLGNFISIASIVGIVSTLRTERKIVSAGNQEDVRLYFQSTVLIAILMSILSFFILNLLISVNTIKLTPSTSVLVVSFAFFYGLYQATKVLASRDGKFHPITYSVIIRSVAVIFFQVMFYFIFASAIGIVLGAFMGIFVATSYLAFKTIAKTDMKNWPSQATIMLRTKDYLKDAFWGGGQALFSALSNNIPLILITTLGGFVDAGLFFLAERFVRLPINLISNNLRNVIISKISANERHYHRFIIKISMGLFALALICSVIAYLFSDYFYLTFFGAELLQSSDITKLMLIWVIFNFLSLPFQTYNANFMNMKNLTFIEAIFLVIKVSCIYSAYYLNYGVVAAAGAIAFCSSLYSLMQIVIYFLNHRNRRCDVIKTI